MRLGAFCMSLAVADLGASRRFYETLGFEVTGGDPEQGWLVLRNGDATIGLFHGMFEGNILTFNPGWSQQAQPLDDFTDVREIQTALRAAGVELTAGTEPDGTGPAHLLLADPDGNVVMIDQHVDRPSG